MLSKSLLKFILEGNYPIHPPSNNSVNLVLGKTHILCLKFTLPILDVNASNIIFSELKKTLNVGFRTSYSGNYKNLESIFLSHHPCLRHNLYVTKLVAGCECVCVCARIKSVVELDWKFDVRERWFYMNVPINHFLIREREKESYGYFLKRGEGALPPLIFN